MEGFFFFFLESAVRFIPDGMVLCLDLTVKLTMNFQYGYMNVSIADESSHKHWQNLLAIMNILCVQICSYELSQITSEMRGKRINH